MPEMDTLVENLFCMLFMRSNVEAIKQFLKHVAYVQMQVVGDEHVKD